MTNLKELKKEYEKLQKKYSLPSFKEMNEEFEIEKLQEKETETLSREIRRCIADKNVAYLRFAEMFMNPQQAPMFFFSIIKGLNGAEKKQLEELYLHLGKLEIENLALDTSYNEKNDIEYIKKFIKEWKEIKEKFESVMVAIRQSWEKKQVSKEKGYLG
mgnify:CR=1 FL=1